MWKIAIVALSIAACAGKNKLPVANDPALRPFTEAVAAYLDVRKEQREKLPKLPDQATAAQIKIYQKSLQQALQSARSRARQGEVFVPSVRPYFVKAVMAEMKGPGGATALRTVLAENPKMPGVPGVVKVAVNAPYPLNAPLTTLPPTLLMRLPTMPEELEYRFVGRALVLRDVEAALIVDYLPDVLPARGVK